MISGISVRPFPALGVGFAFLFGVMGSWFLLLEEREPPLFVGPEEPVMEQPLSEILPADELIQKTRLDKKVIASTEYLQNILKDPEGRVSDGFHVPQGIHASTMFWLKIYTQYSTQDVVLFDEEHPDVIYDVLDFRPLAHRERKSPIRYEIYRKRHIKRVLADYRRAFLNLQKKRGKKPSTQLERKILATLEKHPHRHSFAENLRNLRVQTGQKDNVVSGLYQAGPFMERMESIFGKFQIPPELVMLSLVESSFNLRAHSSADAVGVWQFLERSGKEYMIVQPRAGIDERRSPLKSTVGAARLLKRNYKQTKHWGLAISGYNSGTRWILNAQKNKKHSRTVDTILNPCHNPFNLGFATRNYYPEFLAMLYAQRYRHQFFPELPAPEIRPIRYVLSSKYWSLEKLAKASRIPLELARRLNPDVLNSRRTLPPGFYFALPAGSGRKDDLSGIFRLNRRLLIALK